MGAKRERRTYIFYGPPHFRATWEKFKEILHRDGKNMSQELRIWIEGYVKRKDPGNPQRPLTAWDPGHEDQEKLQEKELYTWLFEYANERTGELQYKHIIRVLRETSFPPKRIADMASDIARRLSKAGITIQY